MRIKGLSLLISCLDGIVLVLALYAGLWLYASRDTVPTGTSVGGIGLGGLEARQALELLDKTISAMERSEIRLTAPDYALSSANGGAAEVGLTWKQAGVSWDAPAFRTELMSLSAGSLWERAWARKNFAKSWELQTAFNPAVLKQTLSPAWEKQHFGTPVNAVRTIGEDDGIRYLPGRPALRIDWDALTVRVQAAIPGAAVPGGGADGPGGAAAGHGRAAGAGGAGQGSGAAWPAVAVELPLTQVQPGVTVETLKREGIVRKIAEYSTGLQTSGAGRLHNVEAAARSIDGLVLAPGGVFDYAKAVAAAERDYGFREAPVIFGGKLVPGVGGGICQVSSTLYNAALLAGLEMVERRNHTLPVSYVPLGRDATFAEGYINFRFKNTSEHHLLISARVRDGRLTVKLFGGTPESVTYRIESRTVEILPAPDKFVVSPGLPEGSREVVLAGKPGYVVETYRTKYAGGSPAGTALLSRDTYPAQPNVIAVSGGSGDGAANPRPPSAKPSPPILEDGIEGPKLP
ncbi:VanW family protein [Paenibacillus sp. M1]|uniref:VanW family protein n=1 Tax=Paenibacillus haidiansis TaxID=1574488 RepID=A0ABU7VWH8_9BACL